ncbi:MAG: alpha/beta hydrolase family protein [Phycisphaerales bacterium]
MIERFARFPAYLAERSRSVRLAGDIPALLAHPDWSSPAPVVLWMHGRTANKELDPGRYLRWVRAGIAACAIDLPGHGERLEAGMDAPARTLDVLERVVAEIDMVVAALVGRGEVEAVGIGGTPVPRAGVGEVGLAETIRAGLFDTTRMAIGGMSAGGMATLRRLCDPHPFRCAAVECTTGALRTLYFGAGAQWSVKHDPERVARIDPSAHLEAWRPIPLLAMHNELDRVVPIAAAMEFVDLLRARYRRAGESPDDVEFVVWPESGAPDEHAGFGRHSNDAKNRQLEFLRRHLLPNG